MYVLMKSLRRERKVMGGGMRTAVVRSHRIVYELTVNLIKKKEDQIRASFKVRSPSTPSSPLPFHDILSSVPSTVLNLQHLLKPFTVTSGEMHCHVVMIHTG